MEKFTAHLELDKFRNILFQEKDHKYLNLDTGAELISVTTKLKEYKEPFRSDYWSIFTALKESGHIVKSDLSKGVKKNHIQINNDSFLYTDLGDNPTLFLSRTPESIKNQWKYESKVGTTRGTIVHNYIENRWFNKNKPVTQDISFIADSTTFISSVEASCNLFDRFMKEHSYYVPIAIEKVIGDEKIAGQPDKILYSKKHNELHILDNKVDKKFDRLNKYKTKLSGKLSHLDDCEFNKYSLQLSMYKYIIEKNTNLKIDRCFALWLFHENPNYELIELTDFTKEIKNILNDKE